jgi:hypothetical protein
MAGRAMRPYRRECRLTGELRLPSASLPELFRIFLRVRQSPACIAKGLRFADV